MKASIVDILKAHAGQENLEVVVEAPASTSVEADLENPQNVIESMNSSDELEDAADTIVGDVVVEGEVVPAAVEAAVEENAEEHAEIHQEIDAAELANELEHKRMENAIADNTREINQMSEVVEAIEEDVEELTDVVDGLECLLEQPTMNRPAANYLFHRANKLHGKLGGVLKEQVAGNESLESEDAYRAAIRDAISGNEGFMESVKKGAEATKHFISELFKRLMDWFADFLKSEERLEKEIKDLEKELDKAEIKEEITVGSWGKYYTSFTDSSKDIRKAGIAGLEVIRELEDCCTTTVRDPDNMVSNYNTAIKKVLNHPTIKQYTKETGDICNVNLPNGTQIRFSKAVVEDVKDLPKAFRAIAVNSGVPEGTILTDAGKHTYAKPELTGYLQGALEALGKNKNQRQSIEKVDKILTTIAGNAEKTETAAVVKAVASTYAKIANYRVRYTMQTVKADIAMVKAHIK